MAFHGHTKIELHNVETGEDKVIEKHNIFTNYLHDIMQILPIMAPTNWMGCNKSSNRYGAVQWADHENKNKGYPSIIDVLCGGLLCFSNTRESDPSKYFLTSDDSVVAKGSCVANAGLDTQLGSYNDELEVSTDTSKTMVWDFTQTQGNGTISTVGLTSIGMGLCGIGGFPKNINHTSTSPFGDVCFAKKQLAYISGAYDDDYPTSSPSSFAPLYCSFKHRTLISFLGITSNKLCLRYYDMNTDVINPMSVGSCASANLISATRFLGRNYRSNLEYRYSSRVRRVTFDLSQQGFSGSSYFAMSITKEGIMYICLNNSYNWAVNQALKFVKIDLMKEEIVGSVTVTNTTGVDLNFGTTTSQVGTGASTGTLFTNWNPLVVDNYIVCRTYSSPVRSFAISLSDSTDVKEILTEEGEAFNMQWAMMPFAGGRIFGDSNGVQDATKPVFIVYPEQGIARRIRTGWFVREFFGEQNNAGSSSVDYPSYMSSDSDIVNVWLAPGQSNYYKYSSAGVQLSYKQDTLTTINVLDEPVIKTPSMTMRITYTVSLEEDEE